MSDDQVRQEFDAAYPLEPWQTWAHGIGVARSIQFSNMRREWEGFQKGYAAGRSAGLEEDVKHITDLVDMAETGHELHGLLRAWINRSTAVLAAGGMGK